MLGPAWTAAAGADGDGRAGAVPFPPFAGVSGADVRLATLTFEAIASGLTTCEAGVTAGDFTEAFALFPPLVGFAPVSFTSQTVQINAAPNLDPGMNPVPEPSTWMLMGTGLIGMLGYGWRKRQSHNV